MAPGNADHGAVQLPMPSAWEQYFPEDHYTATDRRAVLIHELLPFLETSEGWSLLSKIKTAGKKYILEVDYEVLRVGSRSENLVAAVCVQPVEGLACISAAVYEALFVKRKNQVEELFGHAKAGMVKARLFNIKGSATVIRLLKASAIGKLVTIKGTVVRASHVKPLVTDLDFTCGKCGESTSVKLIDGMYKPPTSCSGDGCRGKTFVAERATARSIDWQKLRIQELNNSDSDDSGRIPRTIDVELLEDLVDCCSPGDVVTVLGLVKVISTDLRQSGKKEKCLFQLYLEAVSLTASRKAQRAEEQQGASKAAGAPASLAAPNMGSFTLKDLQFIAKFTEEFEGEQLRHFVHAICPAIYGHELVKAGLVLALFGGVRKFVGSKDQVPTRGDLHLLICGDPGLGKSQLLQAAAAVAPRGIYVCGNSSTSAGLTGTVVKDQLSGSYMCEAGALVLADRGVCCVDEFDKMSGEHQALLGAMEQQEVTISKAGVCATLPARTAILAAANPSGGHYTRAKTILENVKLSAAMLSRFDVIFLLLDRPEESLDERLSEHILAIHAGEQSAPPKGTHGDESWWPL